MPAESKRHFYLVPPTYFSIEYAINKWMDTQVQADKDLAQQQWEALRDLYVKLGAKVETFDPLPGLPDQVFPGDAIFVYGREAIASRFQVAERAGEVEPMVERFAAKGFNIHRLPEGMHFEGNAEAMLWNDRLLCGYGVRSDRAALDFVSETLSVEVLPLEVREPYFHLDIAVCPLDKDTLAYVPTAFSDESRARVEGLDAKLIAIDEEEALKLACNSMSVNGTVLISTLDVEKFPRALEEAGFDVALLDLSEFAKSGGGVKCLTLEAYKPQPN